MLARTVLILVFSLSAVAKALDLTGSGAILATQMGLGLGAGTLLVAGLIVAEAGAATILVLWPGRCGALVVLLFVLALLAGSVGTLLSGWEDCGCFGTLLHLGPATTVAKNVLLAGVATALVRPSSTSQRSRAKTMIATMSANAVVPQSQDALKGFVR